MGSAIARLDLTDAEFGPALTALLVDEGDDGVVGPVDFRSLSVREFGTIYEGLLESQLSVAPTDLTLDKKRNLAPVTKKSDPVEVAANTVYFHNRSGARKSTGSYFTKPFAVEHLLDHSLEPALDDHLQQVKSDPRRMTRQRPRGASSTSGAPTSRWAPGHFLVAAVDRIEARLSTFLAVHPIPPVVAELERLRSQALTNLGDLASGYELDQTMLLRRLVARRCIYGVDLNRIAVELARLAVWIHTFVPGLPLSFLDHNLRWGNSLTGIGTLDEALGILDPDTIHETVSIFREEIEAQLDGAGDALKRLAISPMRRSRMWKLPAKPTRKPRPPLSRRGSCSTSSCRRASVRPTSPRASTPTRSHVTVVFSRQRGPRGSFRLSTSQWPSQRSFSGTVQGSTACSGILRGRRSWSTSTPSGRSANQEFGRFQRDG
ncbi:MAG: hypothetical protein M5U31_16185 [Acidimicrobiia bacterium]|nr:hypothetical protein [Acidimicrobiia bacterium]